MQTYTGGCHCKKVRFEAQADITSAISCNCSHCGAKGLLLAFIPAEQFTLLSGEESLSEYRFNTKIIRHLFCKDCGVQSFSRGVGQDGKEVVALNARCLDGIDISSLQLVPYEGKNS